MKTQAEAPKRSKRIDLPSGAECLLDKAQVCGALGISPRTLQSLISGGEFPGPDLRIGTNLPRWRVATLNQWIEAKSNGRSV